MGAAAATGPDAAGLRDGQPPRETPLQEAVAAAQDSLTRDLEALLSPPSDDAPARRDGRKRKRGRRGP